MGKEMDVFMVRYVWDIEYVTILNVGSDLEGKAKWDWDIEVLCQHENRPLSIRLHCLRGHYGVPLIQWSGEHLVSSASKRWQPHNSTEVATFVLCSGDDFGTT